MEDGRLEECGVKPPQLSWPPTSRPRITASCDAFGTTARGGRLWALSNRLICDLDILFVH